MRKVVRFAAQPCATGRLALVTAKPLAKRPPVLLGLAQGSLDDKPSDRLSKRAQGSPANWGPWAVSLAWRLPDGCAWAGILVSSTYPALT
jgi:hypothetical protein